MQDYSSEERFKPQDGQDHPEEKEKRRGEERMRGREGREGSRGELDSWIRQLNRGSKSLDRIARDILFSDEFKRSYEFFQIVHYFLYFFVCVCDGRNMFFPTF